MYEDMIPPPITTAHSSIHPNPFFPTIAITGFNNTLLPYHKPEDDD